MAKTSVRQNIQRTGVTTSETGITAHVRGQLKSLSPLLRDSGLDDAQVHTVRREIKKLRALVKLVRVPLGKQRYRMFNEALREAARRFSQVRDAAVMHETLDQMVGGEAGLNAKTLQPLRAMLYQHHEDQKQRISGAAPPAQDQAATIRQLQRQLGQWPALPEGFDAFYESLSKTYGSGRDALATSITEVTAENLHEVRKEAKNLRYQIQYLEHTWPRHQKMLEKSLHDLTDLLGQDHDLAELLRWLKEHRWPCVSAVVAKKIRQTIGVRRQHLQTQALNLAGLIYAEKPRHFVRRQTQYWQSPEHQVLIH